MYIAKNVKPLCTWRFLIRVEESAFLKNKEWYWVTDEKYNLRVYFYKGKNSTLVWRNMSVRDLTQSLKSVVVTNLTRQRVDDIQINLASFALFTTRLNFQRFRDIFIKWFRWKEISLEKQLIKHSMLSKITHNII